MKSCIAEFFGTFVLVFAGTGAIVIDEVSGGHVTHVGVGLTFGLAVAALIYAIGDVSGAHLNPAVTVGFWIARQFPGSKVVPYTLSQCGGAIFASLLLRATFPAAATLGATQPSGPPMQSAWLELILTHVLMFVILCVSTGAKEKGVVAGIAIGAVVGFEALFAGPVSGASMNPARSLGPALVSANLAHLWIYLAAPIAGAALAVPLCRTVQQSGCCREIDKACP